MRLPLFLLSALALVTACTALQINHPVYEITTHQDLDKLGYQWQEDTVYFFLSGDSGIGNAQVKRTGGAIPTHVVFNVFLKGLESFALTYGQTRVQVSVSAVDSPPLVEAGQSGGTLQTVNSPTSPLWMPVKIVASMPSIPMTNGYFEVTAPPDFISSNPQSFSIEWIDFHR